MLWGTSLQPLAYYGLLFRCETSLAPTPGRRLVGPCNLKIFTLSASLDVLNTSWVGLCRGSNINQIFQIFRGVSRPSRSIRGPNHGTSYIFWKLWPTAFRFRFPKCIFCQYIFANCTMLMLLLKLCEFILGKSSCARRELIVLACMCKVNLKEAKTVFRSIPWVLSFDAHFFLKESPEVGQEYADGRQERGPQVSPTHPLRSPHPPTGTHPSSGPTAPPSCQFLPNLPPPNTHFTPKKLSLRLSRPKVLGFIHFSKRKISSIYLRLNI